MFGPWLHVAGLLVAVCCAVASVAAGVALLAAWLWDPRPPRDDADRIGPRVLVGVALTILVGVVALMVSSPEPCTDGSGSTACAGAGR